MKNKKKKIKGNKNTIKKKIGDIYVEYPIADPWAPTKKVIGTFPDDFLEDRNQPSFNDQKNREFQLIK